MHPFKNTPVFEREIQPHKMIKSLYEVSSLKTPILFNSTPAMTFNQKQLPFLV